MGGWGQSLDQELLLTLDTELPYFHSCLPHRFNEMAAQKYFIHEAFGEIYVKRKRKWNLEKLSTFDLSGRRE